MSVEIEQLAQLSELAPVGCLVLENGIIRHASAEAIQTMGIPRERLIDVPLVELMVPDFESTCADLLSRVGERPEQAAVRLAAGLAPVELRARSFGEAVTVVAVRSMASEEHYSSLAGGSLTHDLVTGLPNHFHVLLQLNERFDQTRKVPSAILALWIDELPGMTQAHGARTVQRIVKEVGRRLQDKLRAPDLLGRFDEAGFLVLMTTDATAEQLTEIASRLRDEVAFPVELNQALVSFTASVVVGPVSESRPSVERILAHLEAAANRAANTGGNRTDVLAL